MKTVYDLDSQYQLTDEDRANGWTVIVSVTSICYYHESFPSNPSPDQPAIRSWYNNGQLANQSFINNNDYHDQLPGIAARQAWWPNGARKWVGHYKDGRLVSETLWLEDGRQADLIP